MKKISLLLIAVLFGLTSCQKEPVSKDLLYEVRFAPTLNGDVVPWAKNDLTKGFSTFVHKYAAHVIRVHSGSTWITDIPIVSNTPSGSYTCALPAGTYSAMVIPVTNAAPVAGRYTLKDLRLNKSFDVACIFTIAPVSFTVGEGLPVVTLPCVNEMACFQLDLGGTIAAVGVPNLQIYQISLAVDATFITAHNVAGGEQATPVQLQATTPFIIRAGLAGNVDGLWYDSDANIYYAYMIPGAQASLVVPSGNGGSSVAGHGTSYVNYLVFDFANGGTDYPTYWMLDYYNTATWVKNSTLRISYTSASFTVVQNLWFETIVTPT